MELSANTIERPATISGTIRDYLQLVKIRLSLLVVFSASMSYLVEAHRSVDTLTIWLLSIGGFLITGAANTCNQIREKESDKLMKRTCARPLPGNRLSKRSARIFALVIGATGILLLSFINLFSGLLGVVAFLMYVFAYTPLKKVGPVAVIPGAIAGSMPILIGCTAATGTITMTALLLFFIQFIWQFPHTWSIAWMLDEEYNRAGIHMLPSRGRTNRTSAFIIFVSTFLLIPAAYLMYEYSIAGAVVFTLLIGAGIVLTLLSLFLFRNLERKSALRVMLASFFYLPTVLVALVIDRFIS